MNSKVLGSMMIVAGTVIGAGMLAMPINSAAIGFQGTVIELFVFFFLMLIPALAIVELCQFAPSGTSLAGLARLQFGKVGFIISSVLFYVFVYSLVAAYIGGISDVYSAMLHIPAEYKIYFTVAIVIPLGMIVVFSSRVADLVNRVFFYIMLLAFLLLIVFSFSDVEFSNLASLPTSSKAVVASLPIFFLAYGFQLIIPSLCEYLEHNVRQLKIAIVGGLIIPLVMFILWNFVVHGVIPQNELVQHAETGSADIASILGSKSGVNHYLTMSIRWFSAAALITSFIGVTLALITSLRETFAKKLPDHVDSADNEAHQKIESNLSPLTLFILAFILPTVVLIFIPKAFIFFLGMAAIILTIQMLVFPMLCLIKLRMSHPELYTKGTYRMMIPSWLLMVLSIIFVVIAVFGSF